MIVRHEGSAQLLITQPEHAALAGRIMRHWVAGGLPDSPRRTEILLAIDEHDHGWLTMDAAPLLDPRSGLVLDFMQVPDDVRRGVWPTGVERLARVPYAAALVAQHAIHVYRRYRPDPAWLPFFTDMEARRDRHLQADSTSLDLLLRDYPFLRLGDLASLVFCNGWKDPQEEAGYTVTLAGSRVVITPDPFGGRIVEIDITARVLPVPWPSASSAEAAIAAAPRRVIRWTALYSALSA